MHYYQFNIADFALHTAHLTLEEEAVYRRLIDFYYDTELPIPKKTQPVIRRLRLGSYELIVDQILNEFFTLEADGWHNYRCDFEVNEYKKRADRARNNGKKGGRPTKNKGVETQSVILANPEITKSKANQELLTNNQELITNKKIKRFAPPIQEEVVEEFIRKGSNSSDAISFFNHYESNGWMVGRNKMKNWKAASSQWISRNNKNPQGSFAQPMYNSSQGQYRGQALPK